MNRTSYYKQHSEHHAAQGKLSCKHFQQTGQRNGTNNDSTQEVLLKSSMGVTRLPISKFKKKKKRENTQILGSLPCICLIWKGKQGLGKQRKYR